MARIEGDDGLLADDVGGWAKDKHACLTRYIDISSAARKKYLGTGPRKGGTAYFDLFCATGRSRIRNTNEWIDGSAVAAWKASVADGAPFSHIYISDIDEASLSACTERLRRLDAPVIPIHARAVDAAQRMVAAVNGYGLYMALIDPYSLEALDFRVIECLARLKRIDLIIHFSAMDLNRNLDINLAAEGSAFDTFAPGWRDHVNVAASQKCIRTNVVHYWREKITALGKWPSTDHLLIRGSGRQPLYWLLLAASHDLAHRFWQTAANPNQQRSLF